MSTKNSRIILLLSGVLLVGVVAVMSVRISAPVSFSVDLSSTAGSDLPVPGFRRVEADRTASEFKASREGLDVMSSNRKPVTALGAGSPAPTSREEKISSSIHSNSGMKVSYGAVDENSEELIEVVPPVVSRESVWYPVNPRLIGNSLSFAGQRAEVQYYQPSPGSVGVGLSLSVAPQTEADIQTLPVNQADITSDDPHVAAIAGFTYEQELFRTKWGWAAYDQVQKVLREETSD